MERPLSSVHLKRVCLGTRSLVSPWLMSISWWSRLHWTCTVSWMEGTYSSCCNPTSSHPSPGQVHVDEHGQKFCWPMWCQPAGSHPLVLAFDQIWWKKTWPGQGTPVSSRTRTKAWSWGGTFQFVRSFSMFFCMAGSLISSRAKHLALLLKTSHISLNTEVACSKPKQVSSLGSGWAMS